MQPAVEGFWDEQKHPRGQGGRFGAGAYTSATGNTNLKRYSTGSGISTTVPGGGGKGGKGAAKKPAPGPLSFNPKTNTGTGYGTPHGDPRVRSLQTVLNRLHITDKAGAQLIIDGKLGPLTTTAVKKLQAALGVAQNGVVTPALLTRLQHMKQLPKPKPAKKVKVAKPPAPPKPRPAPRPRARRTYHGYSALDRFGVDSPAVARLAEAHPVSDSPALQRWLEEWDAAKHPRGAYGRFGRAIRQETVETRAIQRTNRALGPVRDIRPLRNSGYTEEMWHDSYGAWSHPKRETLEQYKKRATADALARGMTRDELGFFYDKSDTRQRFPRGPSGSPIGIRPPRTERHRDRNTGADRAEAQLATGMSPRPRKYRRARTGALEHMGYRTVGTHTGQRRAVTVKAHLAAQKSRRNGGY
jgi:hypothetical protein